MHVCMFSMVTLVEILILNFNRARLGFPFARAILVFLLLIIVSFIVITSICVHKIGFWFSSNWSC